jgi:hypothetical protein
VVVTEPAVARRQHDERDEERHGADGGNTLAVHLNRRRLHQFALVGHGGQRIRMSWRGPAR